MTHIRWNPGTGAPRIVVDSMVRIPKGLVDVERVRAACTVKNDAYWQGRQLGHGTDGVDPVYELWRETEEMISVPRHFFLTKMMGKDGARFWRSKAGEIVDLRDTAPKVRPIRHFIKLRDKTQAEASKALESTGIDKIISLACGKGKTVVSLHAASEGKRFPLLVVVHTNALKDQWRENYDDNGELIGGIKKFYGLEDHEIGHIQGPKSEWRGYKVAIAMLHTLVLKKFEHDFYRYWRTIIFDEVHRLGAGFFQQAASMFPGERWGLSATVEREDKLDKVFRMHVGEIVYKDLSQPLEPKVFFIDTGISVDMNRFMIRRTGKVNLGQLQTALAENERRNDLIEAWIKRAYKQNRKILVLGERLSQLHSMAEKFQEQGYDASVYVGSTKKDQRRDALTHRIIFATQHIAKEGLDKSNLDTLIITVPFGGEGRARQSLGRILRVHEGKQAPVCCVFVDDIGIISALGRKMKRFIRKFGYEPLEIDSARAWRALRDASL